MKAFRLALAGLFFLWSCIASPAMLVVNELNGFNASESASAPAALTRTYVTNIFNNSISGVSSTTFSTASIGTAAADRYVTVGAICNDVVAHTITGMTIGGNSATVTASSSAATFSAWGILNVTTGTTANIVVSFNSNLTSARCLIGVWNINGTVNSTTAFDTLVLAGSETGDIDVDAGGIILGTAYMLNSATSFTWTNLTERYDAVSAGVHTFSGADEAFAGAVTNQSITANAASGNSTIVHAVSYR